MASPTLPLSSIIDVTVLVSPQSAQPPAFNQALILGESPVIPPWGTNSRVREYTSLAGMLADGFLATYQEYLAASLFFSQSPSPQSVFIGRRDESGTTIITFTIDVAGTGYNIGDQLAIAGGTGGLIQVATINGSGGVLTATLVQDGTGYSTGTGIATTNLTGSGTGCEVNITGIGSEGIVQALQYCRVANATWYAFYVATFNGSVASIIEGVAAWAQTASPIVTYFYDTADANVPTTATTDVMSVLQALAYTRTIGLYSTTQGGAFPNNVYAAAALMGVAMGGNTGLANSYETLMFKQLVGVATEPLTPNQAFNIIGTPGQSTGKNGNIYASYQSTYEIAQPGITASGRYYDEILQIDILTADIQYSLMNLYVDNNSIPQTDQGEALEIHVVNGCAQRSVNRGFIAPGTWEGVNILNLSPGTPMPTGFQAQAPPYSTQSQAAKIARQSMPIYLAINEAGVSQSILIGVYVQQ